MPYTQSALPWAPGSETSHDAAIAAQAFVGRQGARVLEAIRSTGSHGMTQRECAIGLDIGRPSICARVRALEQAGSIRKTDQRRGGCVVYVAVSA